MIHKYLGTGRKQARTGRELAALNGCPIRNITAQIERERRNGIPICAETRDKRGYYIAETPEELSNYCESLKRRAIQLFKTRQALLKTLKEIQAKKAAADHGEKKK